MKLKIALLLIAHVAVSKTIFAQNSATPVLKELEIGDYAPQNMVMGKIINYKTNFAKFSDFKGKLLIIDFWSTYCSNCVAAFPRLDSLQKMFRDKIAIIPSTPENANKISAYLKKKPWSLPTVVEDSVYAKNGLWTLFPHHGNPFEVWIDGNGKVLATTRADEVNEKNISNYLRTGKLDVKISNGDINKTIDLKKPLLVDGNGGSDNQFLMRSILTKELDLNGGSALERAFYPFKDGKIKMNKSYLHLNLEVMGLFVNAFQKGLPYYNWVSKFFIEDKKGVVSLANSKSFHEAYNILSKFCGKEKYCYNLTVPEPGATDSIFYRDFVLNDINRYFDFTARIERKKIPCWIIVKMNKGGEFLAGKADTTQAKFIFSDNIEEKYIERAVNQPLQVALDFFNSWYIMAPPFFNETGYSNEKVNLLNLHLKKGKMEKNDAYYMPMDVEEWRAAFQRNGLDIKVEDREVEVMVFKKKETPSK